MITAAVGSPKRTDEIRSITCNFNDFVRAAPTISKFSGSTQFCIAGNLDAGCDEITDTKVDNGARFVGAFAVDSTTFFSEKAEYSFSKLGGRRRETKEGMDVGSLVGSGGRGRAQAKVEREAERSSNSGNTADNISTVNGAAVSSVSCSVRGFDKNRVRAAIVGSDHSNSFIKESVEVFNSNSFVIAASSNMKVNGKSSTDSLEESFKSAAVINNHQTAKSNLQKDFLDKETSKIMSCNVVSGIDNDKTCEIAHNIHEVGFTTLIRNFAGLPKIDMKDAERAAVRPR